jgi:hypothetical protein
MCITGIGKLFRMPEAMIYSRREVFPDLAGGRQGAHVNVGWSAVSDRAKSALTGQDASVGQ